VRSRGILVLREGLLNGLSAQVALRSMTTSYRCQQGLR
jgi:hypothetical protein